MKQILFKRGNLVCMQGIVDGKTNGSGKAADTLTKVNIKSNVYSKEKGSYEKTTPIEFWNSEEKALSDNARAYLKDGDFISLMATEKDGKYSAIAFRKNNAKWTFPEDPADPSVKEYNIFVGTLSNGVLYTDSTPRYLTSMRIDKSKTENEQYQITFWNNTPKNESLAENARKCLSVYTASDGTKNYKRAAVFCSKIDSYVNSSGDEKKSCKAYWFDM